MTKLFNRYRIREYLRYAWATPANLMLIKGTNICFFFCTGCLLIKYYYAAIAIVSIYLLLIIGYSVIAYFLFRKYKSFSK
jgi:hypothetical protein